MRWCVKAVLLACVVLSATAAKGQPVGPADMQLVAATGRVHAPETLDGSGMVISSAYEATSIIVEFRIQNFGPQNGQPGLIEVLVDGVVQASGTDLSILTPGTGQDYSATVLLPQVGVDTSIDIVARFSGVGDNSPGNNSGTRFFTVLNGVPNLAFANLVGTSIPVALSIDGDPTHAQTQFALGSPILLDARWTNTGFGSTPAGYPVDILLDGGSILGGPSIRPPISVGAFDTFDNRDVGSNVSQPGNYSVSVVLDSTNIVTETSDADNVSIVQFSVVAPELLPVTPLGWDAPIVVSTVADSNTQASVITEDDQVFIDAAWGNLGDLDAGPFSISVGFVGGAPLLLSSPGLESGFAQGVTDLTAGPLPPGSYTLRLIGDSDNDVVEWDEGNNAHEYSFTVAAPTCQADINGDGSTNSSDFNILASHFGAAVPNGTDGDLNGDGVVNSADFNILASGFGCQPAAAAAAPGPALLEIRGTGPIQDWMPLSLDRR